MAKHKHVILTLNNTKRKELVILSEAKDLLFVRLATSLETSR